MIVDLCIFHIMDQRSLILKLVLGCDWKLYVGRIKMGHPHLLPPQACGKSWQGWQFFVYNCHLHCFEWLQGNIIKRVDSRGTKDHWFYPLVYFYWLQGNNITRVGPRCTEAHWVCMCVLVSGLFIVPYNEVMRIFQHILQPQEAANLVLDSGCLHTIFKPDDEVCMPMTKYDIIHKIIYRIYKYNRQQVKERQVGQQLISPWDF